jgi:hypothetical protein
MIPRLLQVLVLITILFMFKEWAYVATYRLYLDHRVDPAVGSTAMSERAGPPSLRVPHRPPGIP